MGAARMRNWLWLAIGGIIGGIGWAMLAATMSGDFIGFAAAGLLIGLALIFVLTFGWGIAERPAPMQDRASDKVALIAYSVLTVAFAAHLAINSQLPTVFAGLALSSIIMSAAVIWPSHAPAAVISAITVLFAAVGFDLPWADLPGIMQGAELRSGLVPPDIPAYLTALLTIAVLPALLASYMALQIGTTAPRMAGWLAAAVGTISFFSTGIAYLRIAPFDTRPMFGAIALGLAFVFLWLTDRMQARRPSDWKASAPAGFAVTAVSLLGFALSVSLTKGWMPLAFAATSLGIAWLYRWRPIAALPWLAVASAVTGAYALWRNAPFPALEIGTTPFLNGLVILVGLPAILLLAGGENLRRLKAEQAGAVVTTFGLAAMGLFIGLELRHWLHDGKIVNAPFTLADMASQTIAALAFALGLQSVAARTKARIYDIASLAVGAASVLMIASGLGVKYNPLFTGDPVGASRIFNMLFVAYLIPGLLAALVAIAAQPVRPRWYTLGYAILSGMLLFLYATAMVRHGFQGTGIAIWNGASDLEFWTYSAIWLGIGAMLLVIGLFLKSQPVRMASGLVIALTICKVFLLDMSALTGPLRAFSFIGLGICLVAIGRLYQRLLFKSAGKDRSGS